MQASTTPPHHLLDSTGEISIQISFLIMENKFRSLFPSLILSLEVLSGQHIPRPHGADEGEVIDPYVEVGLQF